MGDPEDVEVDVQEPDTSQTDGEGADEGASEAETQARAKGWRPQEEWGGNADDWLPADDYLKRGGYKERARRAEEKAADLERRLSEHGETVKRLERMSTVALAQQRKQMEADFAAKKREAVQTGDTDAYDKAERDERKALDDLDKEQAPPKSADDANGLPPAIKAKLEAWVADNPWYTKDLRLQRHAQRFYDDVEEDMPGASVEEKLAEVRERMVENYPDKFGVKKAAATTSRVEGGSRVGNGADRSGSAFAKLPKEAKEQADRFIEDGVYGAVKTPQDKAAAREKYAQTYLEQA